MQLSNSSWPARVQALLAAAVPSLCKVLATRHPSVIMWRVLVGPQQMGMGCFTVFPVTCTTPVVTSKLNRSVLPTILAVLAGLPPAALAAAVVTTAVHPSTDYSTYHLLHC